MILFLQATGLRHQKNLTWTRINLLTRKSLYIGDTPQYVLEEASDKQVVTFDILHHLRLVLVEHYAALYCIDLNCLREMETYFVQLTILSFGIR